MPPKKRLPRRVETLPPVNGVDFDAAMELIEQRIRQLRRVGISPEAEDKLDERPRVRRLKRLADRIRSL